MTDSTASPSISPLPLGPGSLFWDEFGSLLFQVMLPQAFAMQVCHPVIEAGVSEHSTYRTDPLGRARRSVQLLWPVLYARPERAIQKGRELRDLHRAIKGTDKNGKRYFALDPEAYSWVHITGFDAMVRGHHLFGRPLDDAQQEQLYQEWRQFGRLLGVSEKHLPATQDDYWQYFNHLIDERLVLDSVAHNLLFEDIDFTRPDSLKMPQWAWKGMLKLATRHQQFLTRNTLPPRFRARFGIRPRTGDALLFALYRHGFRLLNTLLPEKYRFIPLAYQARLDARRHPEAYHYDPAALVDQPSAPVAI